MSSWVKLSRKLATSAIAAKPEYLAVWVHLLMAASYKEGEILVGRQIVRLLPGQLVFGRQKFSEKVGVSESICRSALKVLENLQQITIKSESKFSVITITKWSFYQDSSPANDQQMTSKRPADDHNKEVLELQEGKDKNPFPLLAPMEGELLPDQRKKKRTVDPVLAESFASFWKLYPKKASKADAVKAWGKIKPDLVPTIMSSLGLHRSCEQWTKDEGQFIPNAATWLNKQKWEDEVKPYVERAEAGRKLSAVELVAARGAERERARQGSIPEYFGQGEFLDGEYSRTE